MDKSRDAKINFVHRRHCDLFAEEKKTFEVHLV